MSDEILEISSADYEAVIFDLDGVITDTAATHYRAWKEVFDEVLQCHKGEQESPFTHRDYQRFVDGKPRFDGIRSFLSSRHLDLPEEGADEEPGLGSVSAIGAAKNQRYRQRLADGELKVMEGALALLRCLKDSGFSLGLVSSSRNAKFVLESVGLAPFFEVRVDGVTVAQESMAGKPAPDMFLRAARQLGVPPERAVVVEDAESGVEAGKAGGFGLVVGLSRDPKQRRSLLGRGADIAVDALSKLVVVNPSGHRISGSRPG